MDIDQFEIRVVVRTLPGKQFEVGRALQARITRALLQTGLSMPAGLDIAEPSSAP